VEGGEDRAVGQGATDAPAGPRARLARALTLAGFLIAGAAAAWGALALWLDGPASRPLAGLVGAAFVAALALPLVRVRPAGRGFAASALVFLALVGWWHSLRPSNERDWQPDVARTPTAERSSSRVTLRDVRAFHYRGENDFDPRRETRAIDLDDVIGLDLFLSFWGPTLYAHTILSFQLASGPPLAVSIETRKEKGESYSALRGFFRQYELVYVIADERDVVGLRARFRGETVRLYRLTTPPAAARALLEQYLLEANALAHEPAWCNALTLNCTTALWQNVRAIAPGSRFDWRLLANGRLDDLAYERGTLDRRVPLLELRARADVSERARDCYERDDFSRCLRGDGTETGTETD
jgi:hypothetical protein